MNKLMSDSEKAIVQIREYIKKLKKQKNMCDSEYYHYATMRVLAVISFCQTSGLITEDEANLFNNEVLNI